jgi:hypothetical protein
MSTTAIEAPSSSGTGAVKPSAECAGSSREQTRNACSPSGRTEPKQLVPPAETKTESVAAKMLGAAEPSLRSQSSSWGRRAAVER